MNVNLIVPNLMPDEFFPGYYGRLLKLNAVTDTHSANAMLKKATESAPQLLNSHPFFKISSLLDIPFENLIQGHTLAAIVSTTNAMPIQLDKKSASMFKLLNRRFKPSSFCEQCSIEDMEYWGFSYWRRSHQLPGSNWCFKHGCTLFEVDNNKKLDHSPSEYLESRQFKDPHLGPIGYRHKYVQKLNELIQDYCDGQFFFKQKQIAQLFRQQADKLGVRYLYSSRVKKTMQDLVIEKFPEDWLKLHVPDLYTKHYNKLDQTLSLQNKTRIFFVLLVASALFSDEVCILSLMENYKCLPRFTKTPDSKLIKGYLQCKGHYTNTARLLGLDQAHVANRLPSLSCPSLLNKKSETLTALQDFYAGKNILEVINNENLDIEEFSRIIRIASAHLNDAISRQN